MPNNLAVPPGRGDQQNEMVDSGRRILSALIQVAQVIYLNLLLVVIGMNLH